MNGRTQWETKQATAVRRVKKSKVTSAAVLVLYGSTALRRRKSAETLAESLKVDLFKVDVSAVVSQYIGETEKNLNDVFRPDKPDRSDNGLLMPADFFSIRLGRLG
ncbi:MAG: AAA family ATPase [Nitrospiraceae bacterium]